MNIDTEREVGIVKARKEKQKQDFKDTDVHSGHIGIKGKLSKIRFDKIYSIPSFLITLSIFSFSKLTCPDKVSGRGFLNAHRAITRNNKLNYIAKVIYKKVHSKTGGVDFLLSTF